MRGCIFSVLFLTCAGLSGINFYLEKSLPGKHSVTFSAEKDFFAELIYFPEAGTKEHICAGISGKNWNALLRHREGKVELLVNGSIAGSYPFYHGGFLGGERRADSYHILLQKRNGILQAFLEGTCFARAELPRTDMPEKRFFTDGRAEECRISSGSIPAEDVKVRAYDRWRGRVSGIKVPAPVTAPPELAELPVIDGIPDKGITGKTTRLTLRSMRPQTYNFRGEPKNFLLIGKKGDQLYLYWQLERKNLQTPVRLGGRDKGLWNVESAEFFLLAPEKKVPCQFIVSTGGELYDALGSDRKWNADVRFAVRTSAALWHCEMLIDCKSAGLPGLQPGKSWKMDFFATLNWESWAPAGRYHDVSAYGELLCIPEAPVIAGDSVTAFSALPLTFLHSLYAPGEVEPATNSVTRRFKPGLPGKADIAAPRGEGTYLTGIKYNGKLIYRQAEIYRKENK